MNIALALLLVATQDESALRRDARTFVKAENAEAKASLLRAGAPAIRILLQERTAESFERIADLLLTLRFQGADARALEFRDHVSLRRGPHASGVWSLDDVLYRLCQYQVPIRKSDGSRAFEAKSWLMFIDPAVIPDAEQVKVDLGEKPEPGKVYLEFDRVLAQHGLDYAFRYGVVLISTPARLWPRPSQRTELAADRVAALRRFVADLDASDPDAREQAVAEIPAFGEAAIPMLKSVAGSTEARARAADLLKKLEAVHGEPVWDTTAAADRQTLSPEDRSVLNSFSESRRQLPEASRFDGARLDAALNVLSKGSGFAMEAPELLADRKITAIVSELHPRDALMLICKTHGLDFSIREGKIRVEKR